jgi:heptosyltransferase III
LFNLVYHAGALGDFITTLPAMTAWRRLHEGRRMLLLGKPGFAALALPAFDEVLDVESASYAPLFRPETTLPDQLVTRLSGVVSALVFARSPSALVQRLTSIGVRSILRQDPFPSTPTPIVDYHLSLFPDLAFTAEERVPRVDTSGSAHPSAVAAIVIHPGSGSARKNWPIRRFTELAGHLLSEGEQVSWIVGPAEDGIALPPDARAWRDLDLRSLAASLARCRLFIGNDSGVTHLAAACGCPAVVLFGGSDPRVWLPRGGPVRAVQSPSLDGISVQRVLVECRKLMGR